MDLTVFTVVSEDDACQKYDFDKFIEGSYGPEGICLIHEGDLNIEGNFDLDSVKDVFQNQGPVNSIIVNGNFSTDGVIFQNEGDFGVGLLVTGTLRAKSVFKGGSEIHIKGAVVVSDLIYGFSNHGVLTVEGDVSASVIVCDDHFFKLQGSVDGRAYDNGEIEGEPSEYLQGELSEVFHDAVVPEEEYLDSDKVLEFLLAGKSILKKTF